MSNVCNPNNVSGLKQADFQKDINGKKTDLFILTNKLGNEVAFTNYGGALLTIMMPDRNGKLGNVVQGHDSIDKVVASPEPFLSTLIGRYGNRIAAGRFTLEGVEYQLALINRSIYPELETMILPASAEYQHFSSSMAREMIRYHQPLEKYLPEVIVPMVREIFEGKGE